MQAWKREKNSAQAALDRETLFATRGARILTEISVVVILALIVVAIIFRNDITIENIVNFSPKNLWLAVLVFLALYALKSLTAIVYVKLLYIAAGLVFPLPAAIAVNIAGTVVQLVIPYFLGRAGGRGAAEFIVKRRPRLGRISALRRQSNFWFSAFVRGVGLFPFDPVSLYFGACGMPLADFLLGSLAGTLPILLVTTIIGTEATEPGSPGFVLSVVLFVVLQVGAAIGFVIWIKKNNAAIATAEKELSSDESAQ